MKRSTLSRAAAALGITLALAACGGGGGDGGSAAAGGAGGGSGGSGGGGAGQGVTIPVDALIAYMAGFFAATSDSAQPTDISGVTLSTSETAPPAAQ